MGGRGSRTHGPDALRQWRKRQAESRPERPKRAFSGEKRPPRAARGAFSAARGAPRTTRGALSAARGAPRTARGALSAARGAPHGAESSPRATVPAPRGAGGARSTREKWAGGGESPSPKPGPKPPGRVQRRKCESSSSRDAALLLSGLFPGARAGEPLFPATPTFAAEREGEPLAVAAALASSRRPFLRRDRRRHRGRRVWGNGGCLCAGMPRIFSA